ncbi:MAG TPA: sigma 54-interacting transcriptional regulator [Terriglobia bacterium]|nr:sigma 54-interacting transcriptional regulator [Terriglobia bacterium]
MKGASQESLDSRVGVQSSAQLILDVARAASHLELAEVLESLIDALKPTINFSAVAVFVIEGEYARLHSLHVEGIERKAGESVESVLERVAARSKMPPHKDSVKQRLSDHHVSAVASSRRPYVCADLQKEKLFPRDEKLLQYGVQSYISLPLIRRDDVIGAVDFIAFEKRAFDDSEVQLLQDVLEIVSIAVSNALAYEEITALKEQLQAENRLLQDEIVQRSIFEEIVGSSQSLRHVLGAIDKVAPTDSTVLITGETGTGKELVAHAIHRRSPRSGRALVKVNCAALPAELIASELFGHEKGAFTGALQQRIGRFETAHGGTIFLDEIGELTQEMQIALLRVLQEKEFERVGGNKTIHTDVRVIAATNRNLEREVADGRFRTDLYYRLNVFPMHVPSLRERADDIPVLVDYFISRFAGRMGKRVRQIEKRTFDAMQQYSWPGNIRELQNVIERGVILAEAEVFRLDPGTLPQDSQGSAEIGAAPGENTREQQKARIEAVLKETRGRIAGPDGAAARLGLPASTLESRIRTLKINKHLFRSNT